MAGSWEPWKATAREHPAVPFLTPQSRQRQTPAALQCSKANVKTLSSEHLADHEDLTTRIIFHLSVEAALKSYVPKQGTS